MLKPKTTLYKRFLALTTEPLSLWVMTAKRKTLFYAPLKRIPSALYGFFIKSAGIMAPPAN